MLERLINVIFALDCFLFSLATLGRSYPYESFSSAAYRAEKYGRLYGKFRPVIDTLLWFDKNHCERSYKQAKLNLPEDMR